MMWEIGLSEVDCVCLEDVVVEIMGGVELLVDEFL